MAPGRHRRVSRLRWHARRGRPLSPGHCAADGRHSPRPEPDTPSAPVTRPSTDNAPLHRGTARAPARRCRCRCADAGSHCSRGGHPGRRAAAGGPCPAPGRRRPAGPTGRRPPQLGPAARPALHYPLGDGTDPNSWATLQQLSRRLKQAQEGA
ncbi:DUF6177 family protein [Streptomyces huasconensis]|uniref:DUF6177 family protein n=1 Tax=Streptomyces huasconensis TaxID=1854574 RepID=UPI0037024B05